MNKWLNEWLEINVVYKKRRLKEKIYEQQQNGKKDNQKQKIYLHTLHYRPTQSICALPGIQKPKQLHCGGREDGQYMSGCGRRGAM